MPGIFTHKAGSPYDDDLGERYHFPKVYLSRVQQLVGDFVAFHELKDRGRGAGAYVGFARVQKIDQDTHDQGRYYARLTDVGTLSKPVPVEGRSNPVEEGFNPQNAVRIISNASFYKLLELGSPESSLEAIVPLPGVAEEQAPFFRGFEEVIRSKREGWFRRRVLRAYDFRCALTGMRLINGGGASEVEAAHIKPVAEGGCDLVQNGLALTRTVHWMFDRNLITFDEDFSLIRTPMLSTEASTFLGNVHMLRPPSHQSEAPKRAFLAFHRTRTLEKARQYAESTHSGSR
ncbi:MAG: HNH endonuclease [Acuticoccus sp.]